MKINKILITSFILTTNICFSQNVNQVSDQNYYQKYLTDKTKAEAISKSTKRILRFENINGEIIEFSRFEGNNMLFRKTCNQGSGRTISTNKVWSGGLAGTALSGIGMAGRLGEWDAGGVLLTHQEFNGRVTQVDGASPTVTHSTHVAGTMIAFGVDTTAKGMSYQAPLSAYDWNNDAGEMSIAANSGMLLSNHSYGTICGWYYDQSTSPAQWEWYGDMTLSTTTDYKYGYYGQETANWDNIAYTNPYYLICKAAGNDRGQNLPNGSIWYYQNSSFNWVQGTGTPPGAVSQYDCMEPTATAKNILTVGAVNKINNSNNNNGWTKISDVVMTSFSGWGPTDDGRIKPDVVAAGYNIHSTSDAGNTVYTTMSGTSMATPAVCGSLLMVQQHFMNCKGRYMLAATLKGLAIHTADEAGNIGPDYTYGWGLLNIYKAVRHITDSANNLILEKTLANGTTYNQNILSDGSMPLRITISWSDSAAVVRNPALNDTTRRLVNDLDIRLKRISDGGIYMPYVLYPASPSNAATTGDNNKDNVEQIYISAPTAGLYTLVVSHKGYLSSPQPYSLLISGVANPPTASIIKNNSWICTSQTVTFTDNSSGIVSQRKWYFPGGNPSTSTATPVTVTYPTAGNFPVALKVMNASGSDSTFLPNAISVGGMNLPFNENFENNSTTLSSWTIVNPGNDTTWRLANTGGLTTGSQSYCMPFYNYTSVGQRDGLVSPSLNFSGMTSVLLNFKHAYTRRNSTSTDSLVVYVSTNCGTSWTRVLSKGETGSGTLATAPNSSLLSSTIFYPATSNDWCGSSNGESCNQIDLSAYAGMTNMKIKFEGYNAHGNNLFIDSINVSGAFIKPAANFAVSKTSACVGESINFADSSINITNAWQWTFIGASTTSSTVKNPVGIIYSSPGTYSVKLVVANANGIDSITKTNLITINPSPNIPTVSSNKGAVVCPGDSIVLTCDSTGNGYKWLFNNQLMTNAIAKSVAAYYAGNYQVKIAGANGCEKISAIKNLIDKPASISISGNTVSHFNKIETYTVPLNTGSIYNWFITNGTQQNGTNTNSITVKWNVANAGNVRVFENAAFGCSGDSVSVTVSLSASAGINEIDGFDNFILYPNPASKLVNIEFDNSTKQTIEISFVNLLGQKMSAEKTNISSGHFIKNIDISSLSKGIYFVEVIGESGNKKLKVVVE